MVLVGLWRVWLVGSFGCVLVVLVFDFDLGVLDVVGGG